MTIEGGVEELRIGMTEERQGEKRPAAAVGASDEEVVLEWRATYCIRLLAAFYELNAADLYNAPCRAQPPAFDRLRSTRGIVSSECHARGIVDSSQLNKAARA